MLLYLTYAAVLPHNTGELLNVCQPHLPFWSSQQTINTKQLDEAMSYDDSEAATHNIPQPRRIQRRILKFFGNGLFAYIVYAIMFVALFNSGTNSLQLGHQVLIIYNDHPTSEDVNQDLIGFIAVTALTVVCLLNYFSTRIGRWITNIFCMVKILALLVLFCAGAKTAVAGPKLAFPVISTRRCESVPFSNYAKALLLVLFSFQGWENGTFVRLRSSPIDTPNESRIQVAGEIPPDHFKVLRNGSLTAVFVIGLLYNLLAIVYVSPYKKLTMNSTPKAELGFRSILSTLSALHPQSMPR